MQLVYELQKRVIVAPPCGIFPNKQAMHFQLQQISCCCQAILHIILGSWDLAVSDLHRMSISNSLEGAGHSFDRI